MPLYNYTIKTSASEASGTIEASDDNAAHQLLETQYITSEHGYTEPDGSPHKLRLENITITEVE